MGKIVFVTSELRPFTPSGIGRVIHNIIKSMDASDRIRSIVMLVGTKVDRSVFAATFPDVQLVCLEPDADDRQPGMVRHHPPRRAYSASEKHWLSAVVYRALYRLTLSEDIDYVEFPDREALGFVTIQENRITGFLKNGTIAVRIHSAHTMLLKHEAYQISQHDCALMDLERKCLRDCDLIVGQLAPVAEATRTVFGFSVEEWQPRLVIHAPPVLLDSRKPVEVSIVPQPDTPIMFGSKVQRFKRPDLFVRAANRLLADVPENKPSFIMAAHRFDADYNSYIDRLVGPLLRERLTANPIPNPKVREAVISRSIFVVPSDFESFSLAAYEASLLGAIVILNGTNPAFGPDTPWKHEINCLKFDGTMDGLANTMLQGMLLQEPLSVVPSDDSHAPWSYDRCHTITDPDNAGRPLVSIVIPHFNLGAYLPMTIESVMSQTYSNIELIVVDDASTDQESVDLVKRLDALGSSQLRVVYSTSNRGLSGARNLGLKNALGKYVLTLDADDLIDLSMVETCVEALERNPEFHCVVTQAGYFRDERDIPYPGEQRDFTDYAVFLGEPFATGGMKNLFSTSCAFFRSEVFHHLCYNESLRLYEDWELYVRMLNAGMRFLVTTDVLFHYRNREGSMVKAGLDCVQDKLARHDILRLTQHTPQMNAMWFLTLLAAGQRWNGTPGTLGHEDYKALLRKSLRLHMLTTRGKFYLYYPFAAKRRRYRKKLRQMEQLLAKF
ncbi:MAG: glycosyltransferase [Desulfobulbaceae bacterium]|nr:glycosyltransferase [Desulfobulbaceae bacterium]